MRLHTEIQHLQLFQLLKLTRNHPCQHVINCNQFTTNHIMIKHMLHHKRSTHKLQSFVILIYSHRFNSSNPLRFPNCEGIAPVNELFSAVIIQCVIQAQTFYVIPYSFSNTIHDLTIIIHNTYQAITSLAFALLLDLVGLFLLTHFLLFIWSLFKHHRCVSELIVSSIK